MLSAQAYLKLLLGVAVGLLFCWVALTGRIGSLLGAILVPAYMVAGTPGQASSNYGTSLGGASTPPPAGADTSTLAQRQAYVFQIFGSYAKAALIIAGCESSMNPRAYNPVSVGGSHAEGMFQILVPSTWNTTAEAGNNPYDYQANTRAAWEIFKRDGYVWGKSWACSSKTGLT